LLSNEFNKTRLRKLAWSYFIRLVNSRKLELPYAPIWLHGVQPMTGFTSFIRNSQKPIFRSVLLMANRQATALRRFAGARVRVGVRALTGKINEIISCVLQLHTVQPVISNQICSRWWSGASFTRFSGSWNTQVRTNKTGTNIL